MTKAPILLSVIPTKALLRVGVGIGHIGPVNRVTDSLSVNRFLTINRPISRLTENCRSYRLTVKPVG
jgi:hypothetical protein